MSNTCTPILQTNPASTNTSSTNNSSYQLGSNIQPDENSFTCDTNKFTSIQEAQTFNSNGSDMIDDESSDTNYTSATNDEDNDHNSIATNYYTTPNINID